MSSGSSWVRSRARPPLRPAVVDDLGGRRTSGARPPASRACRSCSCSPPPVPTSSRASPPWRAGAGWPRRWSTAPASCRPCSSSTVPPCRVPALLLGVADLVVMTEASYGFVNGPVMVEEFTGVRITADELGGAARTGPPHRRSEPRRRRSRGRARRPCRTCSPTCRPASTRSRRDGRADDPVDRRVPGGRRADPGQLDGQLRRTQGRRSDRRRRQPARDPRALGAQRRDGVRDDRRPADRHRRQPTAGAGRHARHPGVAEGGPVRRVLRRVQPAAPHARRHARASTPARTSSGGA